MTQSIMLRCAKCGTRNRVPAASAGKQLRCGKCAAELDAGSVGTCTQGDFAATVLQSPLPVLVDFWAVWCGPCKAIDPVLEQLAGEYAGRARIVKVDVDHCPAVAAEFNIRSIPTLALFRDGEVADVVVGAQGKAKLSKMLDRAL